MILAGIDIGTNTLRLLIADVAAGSFRELASGRIITRLGQDLDRTGLLSTDAQERSLAALAEFSGIISTYPHITVSVVGTSALRNAGNSGLFVRSVKERTGLDLGIISGSEEARLTLLGVRHALSAGAGNTADPLDSALVADIGGGSTELIVTSRGAVEHMQSLHLGAVYLTERHVRHDPPSGRDLEDIRSTVQRELDAWERGRKNAIAAPAGIKTLAGTAGTITTLAAIDLTLERYDPERINGHVLARSSIDRMVRQMSSLTLEERRRIRGLEPGREDIILAGAVICRELMERCGKRELLVSDWGLREGIVLDLYEKRLRSAG